MAGTDSSDDTPQWTREEDAIICARKAEDKSWAEIGAEIERPRRDCQKRYRVLWAHARELGITRDMLAKLCIDSDSHSDSDDDDEEEEEEEEETYYVKRTKAKKGRGIVRAVQTKKTPNNYKKGNSNAKEDTHHKSYSHSNSNSNSNKKTNNKKKKITKKRVVVSSSSSPSSDSDSDSDSESETQQANLGRGGDFASEYWAQRRYFYDNVQHGMYPEQKVLRPDRFFSESDCRILSGLEAKFRADKWLHIQADFCNATGRMVDAEVLKRKFYGGVSK